MEAKHKRKRFQRDMTNKELSGHSQTLWKGEERCIVIKQYQENYSVTHENQKNIIS